MSRRQLYLHIGTGKTGTSALQTFFSDNRDELARHDIIYPHCPHGRIDHHYLGWCLLKKYDSKEPNRVDVRSCDEEWGTVLSQLNGERNLISSELLGGLSFKAVAKIKEYLSDYDIKVVIYLRRYDQWLDSFCNQKVKGAQTCSLPKQGQLKIWSTIFSKESIIVRPYEKGQFYGGTIFSDFLYYAFGLPWEDEFVLPSAGINTHLHRIVMEYKRMVNHLPCPPHTQRAMTVAILRELSKQFFDLGRKDVSVFSPQERLRMIQEHASYYEEIARDYLGREDGRLFYDPLPDPTEEWQPYDVLTEEDARYINCYLAEHHPDALVRIQQGIEAAQQSDNPEIQEAVRRLSPGFSLKSSCRSSEVERKSSIAHGHDKQEFHRQLFIHIGTGKTGTSALQAFWTQNRGVLKKKGIVYPHSKGREAQHQIAWSLLKEGKSDKRLESCNKEWKYIISQLSGSRNLISSEAFSSLSQESIKKVKSYVSSFRVKIVIYLRRGDGWQNSVYNQKIKKKGIVCSPKIFPMVNVVEEWKNVFGKENIIVRPYEKGQFYGGTIFSDFLHHVLGLELTNDFEIPQGDINSRLHRIALEYKRMVNYLPSIRHEKRIMIGECLSDVSAKLKEAGCKDDFIFSPQDRIELIEQSNLLYSQIALDYLGRSDGKLFYEPLPDPKQEWQPYDSLREEDARLINTHLKENHPDVITMVAAGVEAARKSNDPEVQEAAQRLMPGIISTSSGRTALQQTHPDRMDVRDMQTPQKQLYIHLGTHKTGTTALQEFFRINRELLLRKQGIDYPLNSVGEADHHRLGWSLHKEAGRTINVYPEGMKSSREEWMSVLSLASSKLLVSSETLGACRLVDFKAILKYASGFEVKCIIYLRRQDAMAASVYNQITKGSTRKWTDYKTPPYKLNYIECLSSLAAAFGRQNIIVRPYEKQQFHGGTIFADFLHYVFGMELTDEFKIPEGDINSRLHGTVLEYKRLVNFLALSSDQKSSTLGPLLELSSRFFQEGRPDHLLLSPKKRLEIIQQYMPMNERIARDYLGRADGRLFYDPLPDPQEAWQPYAHLAREDAQLINHYLRERYPAVLYTIIEGIMNSLSSEDSAVRDAANQMLPGIAETLEHNTGFEAALECERKDLGASCKNDRLMQWLRRNLPERVKKPARAIARRFRLLSGQKEV